MPIEFPQRWRDADYRPNPLAEAVEARRRSGQDALDLSLSNPAQCRIGSGIEWPRFLAGPETLRYEPHAQGSEAARASIAAYYAARNASVSPSDLFLTAGTSEGYAHLFKLLCDPEDEILVPAPSYPLLQSLAGLENVEAKPYRLSPGKSDPALGTAWKIDRASLEGGLTPRTRAICLVQPNNPTGSMTDAEDAEYVARLAEDRDLALIVDEVFSDFMHGTQPSAPRLGAERTLVFTLNGLSKCLGLPQLKLAWIHVDGPAQAKTPAKQHLEWMGDAFLSVGVPSQAACPDLLRNIREFQEPLRKRLRANLACLRAVCADSRLAPLWPQGGWCVPIRCPGIEDESFAISLVVEGGVVVQPGYLYDFETEDMLVLSLLPEPDIFAEGLRRLATAFSGKAAS